MPDVIKDAAAELRRRAVVARGQAEAFDKAADAVEAAANGAPPAVRLGESGFKCHKMGYQGRKPKLDVEEVLAKVGPAGKAFDLAAMERVTGKSKSACSSLLYRWEQMGLVRRTGHGLHVATGHTFADKPRLRIEGVDDEELGDEQKLKKAVADLADAQRRNEPTLCQILTDKITMLQKRIEEAKCT